MATNKNSNRVYIILMFLGMVPWASYTYYHSMYGASEMAWFCLINLIFLLYCAITAVRYGLKSYHKKLLTYILGLGIIYTSYYFDVRGIVYLYPFIIVMYYTNTTNKALLISLIFAIASLYAVSFQQVIRVVIGLSISISITIIISYLYSKNLKRNELKLIKEANKDYLTGINNRRSITFWIKHQFKNLEPTTQLVFYYIDIDNFKRVNDTYGHTVGDLLLKEISQKLITFIDEVKTNKNVLDGTVSRVAGDEFIVVLKVSNNNFHITETANELLKKINLSMYIERVKFKLDACIGVSTTNDLKLTPLQAISDADQAMFKAKKTGKNRIEFFNEKLSNELVVKNEIIIALDRAIEIKSFFLNFMPIYNSNEMIGVEILIRNDDEILKKHGPDKYIPIAEEAGLISRIDFIVIEKAFNEIKKILPIIKNKKFFFAINISALELNSESFIGKILKLITKYNIPPEIIEFEITETSLITREENATRTLEQLKNEGFKLSLDDFGTGYTAFNQLQNYPVNTLKIDRSFINNINETTISNKNKNSMVEVILSLANLYDLNVVAEGVETEFQLDYLKSLGCHFFQGYLLSKPIDIDEFKSKLFL
ncbi:MULTISPECIES: putative bifunctional diguanylate cyclase/phosphodiesterase [Pseudoalteromonas]|uniref:Bifunctional diguanylate cyclase/phosphodiesterase n=1 Tax=Pseudoalteromonas fuliginea TaxID=1872678 RepID=A0ABD3YCI3_9GAMM|nr:MULTISPECIES: bifunctional diguanylate cyclase/phosphodiesterase [Pseudoalteromonas]ALQ09152.1 hypothetical protein D172_014475 [Pseudoalteromonas sp. Bsw20308]KDC52494.1 hypothetical protein DC53_04520 [Pseudoalteromonas fuliginea]KJZ28246.1 hypothetical protein TW82_08245 [Pseudoalteromonas fuliginea]